MVTRPICGSTAADASRPPVAITAAQRPHIRPQALTCRRPAELTCSRRLSCGLISRCGRRAAVHVLGLQPILELGAVPGLWCRPALLSFRPSKEL